MPRYPCILFLTLMVATLLAHRARAEACGAHAQDSIATDRPQITNSSVVVPCGSLQFENGFLAATPNGGQRGFDFPETSVRFGVAGKTELRFAVPDYFYNDDTASGYANGFGDLILGFKQQLGPTRGFDVSLIPSVSFPTGANRISSQVMIQPSNCLGHVRSQRTGQWLECSPLCGQPRERGEI
jgi:Putative MetA-pathway of phenol degradation